MKPNSSIIEAEVVEGGEEEQLEQEEAETKDWRNQGLQEIL